MGVSKTSGVGGLGESQMVAVVFPFIFIDLGDTSTVLLHGYNA